MCSCSNSLIVFSLTLPWWCHGSTVAGTYSAGADAGSTFLLKTRPFCHACCPIWNQLTFIQILQGLLKLVHTHGNSLLQKYFLMTRPALKCKDYNFLHLNYFLNEILNIFEMYILNLFQMSIFNLAQSEIIDFEKGRSFQK